MSYLPSPSILLGNVNVLNLDLASTIANSLIKKEENIEIDYKIELEEETKVINMIKNLDDNIINKIKIEQSKIPTHLIDDNNKINSAICDVFNDAFPSTPQDNKSNINASSLMDLECTANNNKTPDKPNKTIKRKSKLLSEPLSSKATTPVNFAYGQSSNSTPLKTPKQSSEVSRAHSISNANTIYNQEDTDLDAQVELLVDTPKTLVDRIIDIIQAANNADSLDIDKLNTLILTLRKQNQLHIIPDDDIKQLLSFCLKLISCGTDLIFKPDDNSSFTKILSSIDAGCVALAIITAPYMNSPGIITEELLDFCVDLLSNQLKNNIFDFFSQQKLSTIIEEVAINDEIEDPTSDNEEVVVKKKRKVAPSTVKTNLSFPKDKEYQIILSKVRTLLLRFQNAIRLHLVQQTMIQKIVSCAMNLFDFNGIQLLQYAGISVLTAVFAHFESFRSTIILDTISSIKRNRLSGHKIIKSYFVDSGSGKQISIHVLTALSAQIIQSLPSFFAESSEVNKLNRLPDSSKINSTSDSFQSVMHGTIESSKKCSQLFVQNFFTRIFDKKSIDLTFTDVKAITFDIINELLSILFLPEWPAVQDLLYNFAYYFARFLSPKSEDLDINYKLICIEGLGLILTSIKKNQILNKSKRIKFQPLFSESTKEDALKNPVCPCNKLLQEPLVNCNDCFSSFHLTCGNVILNCVAGEERILPTVWFCPNCEIRRSSKDSLINTLQKHLIDKKVASGNFYTFDEAKVEVCEEIAQNSYMFTDTQFLRQFIIDFLDDRIFNFPSALFSRQFFIAEWLVQDLSDSKIKDVLETILVPANISKNKSKSDAFIATKKKLIFDSTISYAKSQWAYNSDKELNFSTHNFGETRSKAIIVSRQLAEEEQLFKAFPTFFNVILSVSSNVKPQIRSKCVRIMSEMLKEDSSLLKDNLFRKVVMERLADSSITVRESVVDLIGKYILVDIEYSYQYHNVLIARLKDVGCSVRKRTIKLFGDICLKYPNHKNYSDICSHLIPFINDEENTIRNLIIKTFLSSWFQDFWNFQNLMPTSSEIELTPILLQRLNDMASIQKNSGSDLCTLLGLIYKQDPSINNIINVLCSLLVKLIINSDSTEQQNENKLPWLLKLLQSFCIIYPKSLLPHVETLIPYLKYTPSKISLEQLNLEIVRLESVACIFKNIMPLLDYISERLSNALHTDLQALCLSAPIEVLREVVPCYVVYLKIKQKDSSPIYNMIELCSKLILADLDKTDTMSAKRVPRCLFLVGLISKYYEIDSISSEPILPIIRKLSSNAKLPPAVRSSDAIVIIYKYYCTHPDAVIKKMALQGLCAFFSRRPDTLPKFCVIIKSIFAEKDVLDLNSLKLMLLNALIDFIKSEQSRMENFQNITKLSKDNKKSVEPQGINQILHSRTTDSSGPIIEMMQDLLPSVLFLCQSYDHSIRIASYNLIQLINMQGMVLPALLIPAYIAGVTDSYVNELCINELKAIYEKFAEYFMSNFAMGIKQCFLLQTSKPRFDVYNSDNYSDIVKGFQMFYNIFKSNTKIRNAWLKILLELLIKEVQKNPLEKDITANKKSLSFCAFIATIISQIPYEADEPLHILYHASNFIGVAGGSIDTSILTIFEDIESKLESKISIDSNLISEANTRLYQGSIICFLVLVKNYIKDVYDILESKLEGWTPDRVSKQIFNRSHNNSISFNLNVIPMFDNISNSKEFSPFLLEQYRSVRNAIENDTLFYAKAVLSTEGVNANAADVAAKVGKLLKKTNKKPNKSRSKKKYASSSESEDEPVLDNKSDDESSDEMVANSLDDLEVPEIKSTRVRRASIPTRYATNSSN